jgi:hypothetical protein
VEKSMIIQAGDILLNMQHIAAVIPAKNLNGESNVTIVFAEHFQGINNRITLYNAEAAAFIGALQTKAFLPKKQIYSFDDDSKVVPETTANT